MIAGLIRILLWLRSLARVRASREAEILVLRQQLLVLGQKSPQRAHLRNIDRLILVCVGCSRRCWMPWSSSNLRPCSAGINAGFERIGAGSLGGAVDGPGSIAKSGH